MLRELPLDLCVKFWRGRENRLAPREIIDVLSVTGGVPRYLEEVDPSLSADGNIARMCFSEDGPLFKDFNATKDHVKEIARLLGSTRCRFNLIRYHAVPNIPLKSPDAATMTWFRDALNEKGIIATIRASRGQDIDAACGLLSTKNLL